MIVARWAQPRRAPWARPAIPADQAGGHDGEAHPCDLHEEPRADRNGDGHHRDRDQLRALGHAESRSIVGHRLAHAGKVEHPLFESRAALREAGGRCDHETGRRQTGNDDADPPSATAHHPTPNHAPRAILLRAIGSASAVAAPRLVGFFMWGRRILPIQPPGSGASGGSTGPIQPLRAGPGRIGVRWSSTQSTETRHHGQEEGPCHPLARRQYPDRGASDRRAAGAPARQRACRSCPVGLADHGR